ncbi:MAG: hypothetical protein D6730_22260 [Bacteroidetes bacterium]|nr:MAG: hypothetical protein D6730_22260 [Bacteroidota bacterium]
MLNTILNYIGFLFQADVLLFTSALSVEKIAGYFSIALVGTVKFWVSVIMALSFDYTLIEVFLTGSLGAFLGVGMFTYFGTEIRKWWERRFGGKRKVKFSRKRKIYKIWKKYGLWGVAFMGPFISPPVAVAIAVSFKEKPARILLSMSVSIIFWTLIFTAFRDVLLNVAGGV